MTVTIRAYRDPEDFELVYRFLDEIYEPGDHLRTWLPPRWEYVCFHPLTEGIDFETGGIAQKGDGTVVGVVNPEYSAAFGNVQTRPGHEGIKEDLVDWVESHFGGWASSLGRNVVGLYVNDADDELQTIMTERGYEQLPEWVEPYSRMRLDGSLPRAPLPSGFRLQSLAEENELRKVNHVPWRGFDRGTSSGR